MATNGDIAGIILQFVALLLPLSVLMIRVILQDVSTHVGPRSTPADKREFVGYTLILATFLLLGAAAAAVSLFTGSPDLLLILAFVFLGIGSSQILVILWKARRAFIIPVKRAE